MIKKVKLTDCAEGPWKNGKGLTRQIAIYPHGSSLSENNFDWRLSSATIHGENQFSSFPGRNRWLIIWKGDGVFLNGLELKRHTPYHFSGEEEINCLPIGEKVIDLGLIYDPKKGSADLKVLSGQIDLKAQGGPVFLFLAEGSGLIGTHAMSEGDFLILENRSVHLELKDNALAYVFSLNHSQ